MLYMVAFVYIVGGAKGALHVDVTLSLMRAMWGHKTGADAENLPAARFDRLVYYERCNNICEAYARKAELISQARRSLNGLIERRNPGWEDLSSPWFPVATRGRLIPTYAVVETRSDKPILH
jgi:predicted GIY-YIG superfamily endonuclease